MPGGGGKEGAAALLDGDTVTLPLLDTVSPLLAPEPLTGKEDDGLAAITAVGDVNMGVPPRVLGVAEGLAPKEIDALGDVLTLLVALSVTEGVLVGVAVEVR